MSLKTLKKKALKKTSVYNEYKKLEHEFDGIERAILKNTHAPSQKCNDDQKEVNLEH
ncbi:hypothetical protein [Agaribacterium haliotis]|uniref:hypothetical protein n=1 Tax=Agaribacterium haliotis TaxID=2013869 RepID=UPI001304701F|nr:hypothetical protein [Agaribacterium haliotis]